MAVTIQQIAEKAGVSRGTVDRALHNRGRINPQVAERIWELADEMGYVPKERKKRENGKKKIKIGVVTQLAKASFMLEVNRGIRTAALELADRGIELILKEGIYVDEEEQLTAVRELLEEGIQGLAIMPVDCEGVRAELNRLTDEEHIPVVTFNSDIVGTRRRCFVGMDNRQSGRTAAGLMGLLTGGRGKVLLITGYFSNDVDNQRVDGFIEEAKKSYPDLEIAGVQGSFDDTDEVERIVENAMTGIAGIRGILVVSGGQAGVGRAFEKLNIQDRPYVIIYDQTPKNERALKSNVVDFLIDQNGYVQGYRPPHILADLLLKGREPEREFWFTDINIKTKYNL
ncbi:MULTISPECIES: LacI family DNA-binding transcriptional regulator [unclassified Blautia]|uniref:LacI family DNA-binding transcriptional regulator n=1 Tax=unclassified Blautia TaxID=2648079 RepID=UPI000B39AEAC|nr:MULTISPECIES: LacI family DNA-binding transcriptional regulator [unclassified Blautia]OUN30008.1 LacI family transcriptional regulator [Blautia sp. An81]OUN94509.1 LacI family transcriptional regulator [Blautia sp. An46]HJD37434.1 LacI family DNA-binding transcriptional regulator [Candidatus Blautia ornithocaccae]